MADFKIAAMQSWHLLSISSSQQLTFPWHLSNQSKPVKERWNATSLGLKSGWCRTACCVTGAEMTFGQGHRDQFPQEKHLACALGRSQSAGRSLPKDAITVHNMVLTCFRRWCSGMLLERNPIFWTSVYRHNHPICGFLLSSHAASSTVGELKGTASRHVVAVSRCVRVHVSVCACVGHSQAAGDLQSLLADTPTVVIQHLAAHETTSCVHSPSVQKYSVFPVLWHLPCYLNAPCD